MKIRLTSAQRSALECMPGAECYPWVSSAWDMENTLEWEDFCTDRIVEELTEAANSEGENYVHTDCPVLRRLALGAQTALTNLAIKVRKESKK